jgi:hypothetical protein
MPSTVFTRDAVVMIADLTAIDDHFGFTPKYKAAIPAMWGAAIEVPE